ncbi:hypothetical protein M1141_03000 [Candidatus Marsarchaeota archaeon]|nr:hypothetical protein [Candidatus Marsarchaeota archaeon]
MKEISIVLKRNDKKIMQRLRQSFRISKKANLCLAIGGDGTFIKAATMHSCPILPIRMTENGSIGYYSDLTTKDLGYIIKNIKNDNFVVQNISNKLQVVLNKSSYFAINEIELKNVSLSVNFVLSRRHGKKAERIYPYVVSGDGMIVTTLLGSTAYNRTAKGPIILAPNVLCITFLNIDGPYSNPIIVGADEVIEVKIAKYEGILKYDGKIIRTLREGDKFQIMLSNKQILIARFKEKIEPFHSKLDRLIKGKLINK